VYSAHVARIAQRKVSESTLRFYLTQFAENPEKTLRGADLPAVLSING